ncbi:hypothetical protein [Streptomyces yangpuensis]|uniref:hypothetical protein n=1 Tax=Streptomyces yangpuensis TaxID=1648182 RepID=UPI0035E36ACF
MRGYPGADPDAVAAAMVAGAVCETTAAYMRQQTSGLLHESVLADPDFSFHPRAVMGPAGVAWLEGVPMEEEVAVVVLALAGDGAAPRVVLDDAQWATVYAVSAVARLVGVFGVDATMGRLDRIRAVVALSAGSGRRGSRLAALPGLRRPRA